MLRIVLKTLITSAAIAIFALIGGITTNAFAGTPMDEAAFKKHLVDHSWHVKWEQIGGTFKVGEHTMRLDLGSDGGITGALFNSKTGAQLSSVEKVKVMANPSQTFSSVCSGFHQIRSGGVMLMIASFPR